MKSRRALVPLLLTAMLAPAAAAADPDEAQLSAKERYEARLLWLERARDADKRNCANKGVTGGRYCERRADSAYRQGKAKARREYEAALAAEQAAAGRSE